MTPPTTDLLVLGSGVAGLSAAVRGRRAGLSVVVLTKGELGWSATRYAQGGVAAALDEADDSPELHGSDTLAAGGGLCDPDAVRVLASEGPARVRELMELGALFDRVDGNGALARAREGGHSVARVVHAGGDATGAEIERTLVAAVHGGGADVREGWLATDLLVDAGRVVGVSAVGPDGPSTVYARHVVVATGGAGQCFAVTTNPALSTG
ncbi:MAG TPA: FAD-dependent oxidoreductase, partial [Acidimicrobiia bacterium]